MSQEGTMQASRGWRKTESIDRPTALTTVDPINNQNGTINIMVKCWHIYLGGNQLLYERTKDLINKRETMPSTGDLVNHSG